MTTLSGQESVGQTTISVNDSSGMFVRDIVKFAGHNTEYRVTSIPDGTSIVVEAIGQPAGTGLTATVASGANVDRYWEFYNSFDKAPAKSGTATSVGGSDDELHIVISDEDGLFSGVQNTILETYGFVSLATDSKDSQGQSNYYKNVIARESEYVYWSGHSTDLLTSANEERTHLTSATIFRKTFCSNQRITRWWC